MIGSPGGFSRSRFSRKLLPSTALLMSPLLMVTVRAPSLLSAALVDIPVTASVAFAGILGVDRVSQIRLVDKRQEKGG